jgi:pimeloyl-ACP methyl ester carboxylesterase
MSPQELAGIGAEVHLLVGERDPLFPYRKSVAYARAHLRSLASVEVFPGVAHGIELSTAAIAYVAAKRP